MSDSPTLTVARRPRAAWLFVVLTVLFLGMDLGLKAWAFRNVAPKPVRVEAGEKGPQIQWEAAPGDWKAWNPERPDEMVPHEPKVVVPKVLNLRLLVNQGAVFGIGQGQRALFIVVSLVALIAVGWYLLTSPAGARWMHAGLALILAGALGNLYDRILFKGVRDMLYLFPEVKLPFGWHWPGSGSDELYPWIFNLADVQLIAGVVLLLILGWRSKPAQPAKSAAHDQA